MVFSSTISNIDEVPIEVGRKKIVMGTFTNTLGSTGGNITVPLTKVEQFYLQHTGAAVVADHPSVNETMPFEGSDVTIVTTADADGIWMAVGVDH